MSKVINRRMLLVFGMSILIVFSVFTFRFNFNSPQAHSDHIADFSDDRNLSGAVHNIFIGEVKSQVGNKQLDHIPETQFEVEVIKNIKGELIGNIVVNQQGGYNDNNELILIENDQLLQIGQKYLFATRYLDSENWHTLVPNYGDIKIKDKDDYEKLISRFEKAYKNEIKFKFDKEEKK